MRFSQTVACAIIAASVAVEAAPAPITDKQNTNILSKRGELERALEQYLILHAMKSKRDLLNTELSAREYAIVTDVLTAIKDTGLAPVVLKFFVKNATLSNVAIDGVVFVVKSGIISAKSLLSLLVQSGLITSVLNDVLGNCEVYASIISIGETLLKGLFTREDLSEKRSALTHDQGLELLRRDGLMAPSDLDHTDTLEARDLDDVVLNLLESLAASGLGSQVVETVLTDTQFLAFGAKLIQTLYADGLLKLDTLVSAVTESGLLPALLKELLNISTLETIAKTAISAATGKCSSNSTVVQPATAVSATKVATGTATIASATATQSVSTSTSSSSLLGLASSLLGGTGILSGVSGLLNSFFGDNESTNTTATTTVSTVNAASAKSPISLATSTVYACLASSALTLQRKRMRMY